MGLKQRVYETLESDEPSRLARIVRLSVGLLILINVIAIIVESHLADDNPLNDALWGLEVASVIVFSLEYLMRVWSITVDPRFADPFRGRLRFMLQPLALVDLISILPFYLPFLTHLDLRVTRVLRIIRLVRVLKLGRYSTALQLLFRVLARKKEDLASTVFLILVLLVIASSLMFYAEHDSQPGQFPSISAALWWGVTTLTTVGYGDLAPITTIGKIIAGFIAVLGVGIFAMPAGIIASGYADLTAERRADNEATKACPDCAEAIKEAACVCRYCGFRWREPAP